MTTIKLCVAIVGFTFAALVGRSQTYSIPWAQQQPAWVFPLWFEDATGAKDTLYLSYASYNSSINMDTIYGSIHLHDSSANMKFSFESGLNNDTTLLKALICNELCFPSYYQRNFFGYNVTLPLTIRWDPVLFYSDSLPLLDQSPAPRMWAKLAFDFPLWAPPCYDFILMTDTPTGDCFVLDSARFENQLGGNSLSYFEISFFPWAEGVGIEEVANSNTYLFPVPAQNTLTFRSNSYDGYDYAFFDPIGRIVKSGFIKDSEVIDISDLPPGCYFIALLTHGHYVVQRHFKIIKQ